MRAACSTAARPERRSASGFPTPDSTAATMPGCRTAPAPGTAITRRSASITAIPITAAEGISADASRRHWWLPVRSRRAPCVAGASGSGRIFRLAPACRTDPSGRRTGRSRTGSWTPCASRASRCLTGRRASGCSKPSLPPRRTATASAE